MTAPICGSRGHRRRPGEHRADSHQAPRPTSRHIAPGADRRRGTTRAWPRRARRSIRIDDIGGADTDALARAVDLGLGAETSQQLQHGADVGEIGHIAEDALVSGEQCGRQRGQGGILGATDGDGAAQRDTPADTQHPFLPSGIRSDRALWCSNRRCQWVLPSAGVHQPIRRPPAMKRIP